MKKFVPVLFFLLVGMSVALLSMGSSNAKAQTVQTVQLPADCGETVVFDPVFDPQTGEVAMMEHTVNTCEDFITLWQARGVEVLDQEGQPILAEKPEAPNAATAACIEVYATVGGQRVNMIPGQVLNGKLSAYVEYRLQNNCPYEVRSMVLYIGRSADTYVLGDYVVQGPSCVHNSTIPCTWSFDEFDGPYWDSIFRVTGLLGNSVVAAGENVYLFYQWIDISQASGCVHLNGSGTFTGPNAQNLEAAYNIPPADAGGCIPGATNTPMPTATATAVPPTATATAVPPTATAGPSPTPTATPKFQVFLPGVINQKGR